MGRKKTHDLTVEVGTYPAADGTLKTEYLRIGEVVELTTQSGGRFSKLEIGGEFLSASLPMLIRATVAAKRKPEMRARMPHKVEISMLDVKEDKADAPPDAAADDPE